MFKSTKNRVSFQIAIVIGLICAIALIGSYISSQLEEGHKRVKAYNKTLYERTSSNESEKGQPKSVTIDKSKPAISEMEIRLKKMDAQHKLVRRERAERQYINIIGLPARDIFNRMATQPHYYKQVCDVMKSGSALERDLFMKKAEDKRIFDKDLAYSLYGHHAYRYAKHNYDSMIDDAKMDFMGWVLSYYHNVSDSELNYRCEHAFTFGTDDSTQYKNTQEQPTKSSLYAPYELEELRQKINDLSTAESLVYRSQRYFWKGTLSSERAVKRMEQGKRQIGFQKVMVVVQLAEDDHKKGLPISDPRYK